jgi:hypothetical protein
MRYKLRRGPVSLLAIMVMLVAALTSACGGGSSVKDNNVGPPAITYQEANKEYFDEAARWTLPAGWRWPESLIYNGKGPDGARMVYEPTTGRIDATHYWFCAWSWALLGAGSEADRANALGQVLRLPETSFYKIGLLPEDQAGYDIKLDAAKAGDLTALTETTELNCPRKPQ